MTTRTDVIDHAARRLVVGLATPYDAAREHYETLVPEADLGRFSDMTSWQATLELAEINAPHGFMRYYRSDITAVMNGSASCWKATQYLMGNHTIAERMYSHDPSVMLHAPCGPSCTATSTSTRNWPSTSRACCSPATETRASPTSAVNSTPSSPGWSPCSAARCPHN